MALGTAPKVKALLNTSSPGCNPAHFIINMMALPQLFKATQYLCPVYSAISTSHLDTVLDAASLTLYRYIRPEDMRETASSIPDCGTGSGVLISLEMTVLMGLVRRALVPAAKATIEARGIFVNLVAGMFDVCFIVVMILNLSGYDEREQR
jgi:hypothetical protein